jgi:two-component system, LuxR family, sensor kinase FixL
MTAATCLTLGAVHLLVWVRAPKSWSNLLFCISALAVAVIAGFELAMMRAQSTAQFGVLLRWMHVPLWVIVVSLVLFMQLYLRAGRVWLVWTVCGLRTMALVLNFACTPNLNFREITSLKQIHLLGESVSVPIGVTNPWTLVGQLSSLFFLVFVVDAAITAWRSGDRHRALAMGGSMAAGIVVATSRSVLVIWGIVQLPNLLSQAFLAVIVVMAYELSQDLLRAARLSRELQTSEAEFRSLFELSAVGAAQAVPETGRLTRVNKRFCEITGYSSDALRGMTYRDLTHPDDVALDAARIRLVLQGQAETWESEKRYIRKDGSIVWVLVSGTMIPDHQGHSFRTLATIQDITQRKRAEEAAVEHHRELAHLNRVSTMGELAASLAHELKQPLTGILSNAQAGELLLNHTPPDTGELREVLASVVSDTRRASEIIGQMRDFLRKRDIPRRPVDPNVVVEQVLRILRSEAVIRDIRLVTELTPNLPRVMGDPIQLQQVLLNLIANAEQAMSRVAASRRELIVRTSGDARNRVVLTVEDSGPGFEAGTREKVFQPFFTTRAEGIGMGLTICQSIVEDHRGSISAEDRPEGGALIRVDLPAVENSDQSSQSAGGKI